MGKLHARTYASMEDVDLVAVADPMFAHASSGAYPPGLTTCSCVSELLSHDLDAVTIAAPTPSHHDLAVECLDAGINVLIEKPIATTLDEANDIIAAGARNGRLAMVGHIERFNSTAIALKKALAGEKIVSLRFQRSGPFPVRMTAVGVVTDSAIHDIDLARWLTSSDIIDVHCYHSTTQAQREDNAEISMRTASDVIVHISADWLSPRCLRVIEVRTAERCYRADLLHHQLTQFDFNLERGRYSVTELPVPREDSLRAELEAFVRAVRGDAAVSVDAHEGARNLEIALQCVSSRWRRSVPARKRKMPVGHLKVASERLGSARPIPPDRPFRDIRAAVEASVGEVGTRIEAPWAWENTGTGSQPA